MPDHLPTKPLSGWTSKDGSLEFMKLVFQEISLVDHFWRCAMPDEWISQIAAAVPSQQAG
jgi:hypothetical protein